MVCVKMYDPEKNEEVDGKYLNNVAFTFDVDGNITQKFCTMTVTDDGAGRRSTLKGNWSAL